MGLRDWTYGKTDGAAGARAGSVLPADAQGTPGEDRTNERDPEGPRRSDAARDRALPSGRQGAGLHLRFHRDVRHQPADRLAPHGQAARCGPRRGHQARYLVLLPSCSGPSGRHSPDPERDRLSPAFYCSRVRLAILSDIHGNTIALDAVLEDIQSSGGVDGYLILGDLAAIGPDPVGVLERVAGLPDAHVVRGNGDRYVVTGERPDWYKRGRSRSEQEIHRIEVEVERSLSWTQGFVTA